MASFIRLLLLLGIIGAQVVSSGVETVTPINSVTFQFLIQMALIQPSYDCPYNDSVTTPMLLAALHSLFCMNRRDMIVVNEAYANACPADEERAWLWESFVIRSLGRENGGVQAESSSNGNFTWVIWSIDFFILKIPESFIEEALQGANHTNRTVASMEVAQTMRDQMQELVNTSCTGSFLDGLLRENVVKRNCPAYCGPLDVPDLVLERWAALEASSKATRVRATDLCSMLFTMVLLWHNS